MLVAIDTATSYASLALHDGTRVRVEHTWACRRRHTIEVLSRLTQAMKRLKLDAGGLSGVAVTRGPGSFTGLRVGMAIAKGLALAQDLPLIGVPTLDVIAEAQGQDSRPLCAVLKAGRSRISVSFYRWTDGSWEVQEPPYLTTWELLVDKLTKPTLICGEISQAGLKRLDEADDAAILLPPAKRLRRAGFLADIGWRRLHQGQVDAPATLTPLYLKQAVR